MTFNKTIKNKHKYTMVNTNLKVVTSDHFEDALQQLWDAMKIYVAQNIDTSNLMTQVKEYLDEANREIVGTTATEKAEKILDSVNRMFDALRDCDVDIRHLKTSEIATKIRELAATGYEVCILGKSGQHYTPQDWRDYVNECAEQGIVPEPAVPAVITPYQSFVIGLPTEQGNTIYITRPWGNTTDNLPNLLPQQQGSFVNVLQNNLMFQSLENTKRMLLWYNPEVLPTIDYDMAHTEEEYYNPYPCVRFETYAEMTGSSLHLDATIQVYVVKVDNDSTTNVCYYWGGNGYTKRFQVPRFANNITGSPAAEFAWNYKAWYGDTRQWTLPTTNHLLMMYVYQSEIIECLAALTYGPLPSGSSWSCQQFNTTGAYYVAVLTGAVNASNGSKNSTYAVVPVAAL